MDEGLNLKGMVPSRPVVVVAACVILRDWRRGMRKVEVHPAPRISISTGSGCFISVISLMLVS